MTTFSAHNESTAIITANRSAVWEVITNPDELARLTPLLDRIVPQGELWRWEMGRIPGLGVHVAPAFTEKMVFDPEKRIDFVHSPPNGTERAAVNGFYKLEDHAQGTYLEIRFDICVDLPLPKFSSRAVNRTMAEVMGRMGDSFAKNLLRELNASQVA